MRYEVGAIECDECEKVTLVGIPMFGPANTPKDWSCTDEGDTCPECIERRNPGNKEAP